MAIKYNPYNWEIRKDKKTIKGIKKKDKNLFKVKMEIECNVTREELINIIHESAKEVVIEHGWE